LARPPTCVSAVVKKGRPFRERPRVTFHIPCGTRQIFLQYRAVAVETVSHYIVPRVIMNELPTSGGGIFET